MRYAVVLFDVARSTDKESPQSARAKASWNQMAATPEHVTCFQLHLLTPVLVSLSHPTLLIARGSSLALSNHFLELSRLLY